MRHCELGWREVSASERDGSVAIEPYLILLNIKRACIEPMPL